MPTSPWAAASDDERSTDTAVIDSHCHLAGEEFEPDLDDVVRRARDGGVAGVLVILSAGDAQEASRAERVRALWPAARFATGIHPHHAGSHAGDLDASLQRLEHALEAPDVVAVGEIGLDYHYDFAPRGAQLDVFRAQLRLARARGLPVVIHTRDAADDTLATLAEEASGVRTVFHCFTGTREMAEQALAAGAWLSFSGIVTFPRAEALREVARLVPPDRYLVETDAPYLAPVPHRGARNEPAHVSRVVEVLAEVRGCPPAQVAREASGNFARVFGPLPNPHADKGLAR